MNLKVIEAYWTNYCSEHITDVSKRNKCNEYSVYIKDKINDSKDTANNLSTSSIIAVKADLSNLKAVSQQYQELIAFQ